MEPGANFYLHKKWAEVFDLPAYNSTFEKPEYSEVTYHVPATIESVLRDRLTWSPFSILKGEEKEKVVNTIKDIVQKGDGKVWIDEPQGIFEAPYKIPVLIMKRKIDVDLEVNGKQHA